MTAELERVTMLGKWRWLRTVMQAPGASKAAMQVAGALAEYWNPEHGIAWPGQARLARECGMGERTVVRAVAWLEAHGFVVVIRRGRSNAYAVNWAKAATVNGCHSGPGKVPKMAYGKGATDGTLSESYRENQSTEQNLRGTFAEGEPLWGASVTESSTHYQPSAVDKCGTTEQHEPPEPGFEDRPDWYGTQEPDDGLEDLDTAFARIERQIRNRDQRPAPAYEPEPEPELPSRQLERKLGGKPPVGSKLHAIYRLQRRFEGVCAKIGQDPSPITDYCTDEGLEDLIDMQDRNDSSLGSVLAEYVALDFHEKADFFEPRGQCCGITGAAARVAARSVTGEVRTAEDWLRESRDQRGVMGAAARVAARYVTGEAGR